MEVERIALSRPDDGDLPSSTWSLTKLAEYLVAERLESIGHEGLRKLLDAEGVSFQRVETCDESHDPEFEDKKNHVLELHEIADGTRDPSAEYSSEPICLGAWCQTPLPETPENGSQIRGRESRSAPLRRTSATHLVRENADFGRAGRDAAKDTTLLDESGPLNLLSRPSREC